jgi:uncharacterized protein
MTSLKKYEICIITGGSSGIGLAMIHYLQKHHPQIAIFNLSRTASESIKGVTHISCDLSSNASIEKALTLLSQSIKSTKGHLLLINNAGFGTFGNFETNTLERELGMIAVNTMAPIHLAHTIMPELLARKGAIVTLSSAAAFRPIPKFATYSATKSFLLYWALSLADEITTDQIQVLTVCPQRVDSAFFAKADPQGKRMPKRTPIPAKRIAEETFRALEEKQNLLLFSAMDVLRVILMRPSLAWKTIKNTTLFRES